jgi:hypothetical protein
MLHLRKTNPYGKKSRRKKVGKERTFEDGKRKKRRQTH